MVVGQTQGLLGQEEGQLEGYAIKGVGVREPVKSVSLAADIIQVGGGDSALLRRIQSDAVIPGGD